MSILVATRERPRELRRLLASIAGIKFRAMTPPTIDVVVVDNGPEPEGYDADELSAVAGAPVRVVREPTLGIPFARNTALRSRHPDAQAVVFVDDDCTVPPSWLEQLLIAWERHEADFVTGPALQRFTPSDDLDLNRKRLFSDEAFVNAVIDDVDAATAGYGLAEDDRAALYADALALEGEVAGFSLGLSSLSLNGLVDLTGGMRSPGRFGVPGGHSWHECLTCT